MSQLSDTLLAATALPATALDRLWHTYTFRGDTLPLWLRARIGVIGAGVIGGRLACEIVRSGASVEIFDHGIAKTENLGTQLVTVTEVGVPKVEPIVRQCDTIATGRATGFFLDVRHVGIGTLRNLSVLIDCTDDPGLLLPLTRISNGLGVPLLRCAVDGTGQSESGRVMCSAGSEGRACQVCCYSSEQLLARLPRTPCPGAPQPDRPPTFAGITIAMMIAGLGLLQAQRLVTGDLENVVDREILLDVNHFQLLPNRLHRSAGCLSGHIRWNLEETGLSTAEATLEDLFDFAESRFTGMGGDKAEVSLEPYAHPLNTEAGCVCGRVMQAVGSRWSPAPDCPDCGQPMQWRPARQLPRLRRSSARQLGIGSVSLDRLGLPDGAMIVGHSPGKPALRMLLN